jgi:hypothetical protein
VSLHLSIPLTTEDYEKVLEYVLKLYYLWGGARGDFRQSGVERDIGKYIHDHMGGKLAEIGVARLIERDGRRVKIGFAQYTTDEEMRMGDIEGVFENSGMRPPNFKVQIKETKPGDKWWMIP